MDFKIYPAFAVPFADAMHPEPAKLNGELRELILRREAEGDRHRNLNTSLKQQAGVFESEFTFFGWPEACVQTLRLFCWTKLGQLVAGVNGYTEEQMRAIRIYSHTWFHVTRAGGFTITHTHPMASWSGVYCVDPGDAVAERPESGVLRFHNPHYYSNMFLDPGNAHLQAPYHHGFWSLPLKAGQLVLFPSWVPHEVMPYYGARERITVAFNCWFGGAG